jgi:hypothetical protein
MLNISIKTTPPLNQRRCPKCGRPMFLTRIEPAGDVGQEVWTFECSQDAYAETMTLPTG